MAAYTSMKQSAQVTLVIVALLLGGCGAGSDDATTTTPDLAAAAPAAVSEPSTLIGDDAILAELIADAGLTGDPAAGRNLPSIDSAIATLGKFLFFSTNLGGEHDAACVSCHHPETGGGDALSLAVGVHAVDADDLADPALIGPGRHPELAGNFPLVPRNSPSVFNAGLWDRGLFWDSRVLALTPVPGSNGTGGAIATPDSATFDAADTSLALGTTLPAAQARFPVTSASEMRADFAAALTHQELRELLATRFDDGLGEWSALFAAGFGDPAITFDRISTAIGEYERSMNFTDSPWSQYVKGDLLALPDDAKAGAILFFTPVDEGGAGCSRCHSGDSFSDGRHHLVAFPQVSDDLGREAINGDAGDRYHFRTPSLLNAATTAPYGHAGLYDSLEEVVRHYNNPRGSLDQLFGGPRDAPFTNARVPVCELPQLARILTITGDTCQGLMQDAYDNSMLALDFLQSGDGNNPLGPRPNLDGQEVSELVAFLTALTDPCVTDRLCLDPWIVDGDDVGSFPDLSPLIAHDEAKLDL